MASNRLDEIFQVLKDTWTEACRIKGEITWSEHTPESLSSAQINLEVCKARYAIWVDKLMPKFKNEFYPTPVEKRCPSVSLEQSCNWTDNYPDYTRYDWAEAYNPIKERKWSDEKNQEDAQNWIREQNKEIDKCNYDWGCMWDV